MNGYVVVKRIPSGWAHDEFIAWLTRGMDAMVIDETEGRRES